MKPIEYSRLITYAVPYPLKNIKYLENEIFTSMIYYTGNMIPWYYVSNYGRIYSCRYERLIKQYLDDHNYYRITLKIDIEGHTVFTGAHKIELMSFQPIINQEGIFVPNHKNGITTDNRLSNLEWLTVSENTRHALDIGLSNCTCDNNARSYLTNEQVHFICSRLEKGLQPPAILNEMNIPYGIERNRLAAIIRQIRGAKSYLEISSQYNIPGVNGRKRYDPEFTKKICELLSDGNIYTFTQICDLFNVELKDRKLFKDYLEDIFKGKIDTYITSKYTLNKFIMNISKDDPNYYYYF